MLYSLHMKVLLTGVTFDGVIDVARASGLALTVESAVGREAAHTLLAVSWPLASASQARLHLSELSISAEPIWLDVDPSHFIAISHLPANQFPAQRQHLLAVARSDFEAAGNPWPEPDSTLGDL